MADATKVHAFLMKACGETVHVTFDSPEAGGFQCNVTVPSVSVNGSGWPKTTFAAQAKNKKAAKGAAMSKVSVFVADQPAFKNFVQADDPEVCWLA